MTLKLAAEWAPHRTMWLGFPSHADLWENNLEPAQVEVAALALALAGAGGERVRLMVRGEDAASAARDLLAQGSNGGDGGVEIVASLFGDIWVRDTGPIFVKRGEEVVAAAFLFNGWGGKYNLDEDDLVAEQIAAAAGAPRIDNAFILEGGAIDADGFGTILTTRQCLLNPNRNPGWNPAAAEAALADALGAQKILWLNEGLQRDHTDGHVDNLARFVAPGVVACPVAFGFDDPNAYIYDSTAQQLSHMKDARGVALQVVRIPSPGRIKDEDGAAIPASHMNFIIGNKAVIMPMYEDQASSFALDALRSLFPEREVIGLSSRAILSGGGSFHCITQQEPV
jgi:agmatine deiminase